MTHGTCLAAGKRAALAAGMPALLALFAAAPAGAQEAESAAERGAEVYLASCSYCHDRLPADAALDALPGVASLELKYGGRLSPYIRERPDLANADVLTAFLRNGAGSMQPFRKTELTDADIAAIAAYFAQTSAD